METKGVVIDTGIFIEFLRAKDKTKTALYKLPDEANIFISAVTYYELLIGATTQEKHNDIKLLTEDLSILPFNADVASKAAEIYHLLKRSNNLIEFRDIFIAATCLVNDVEILTLNKKHFERIEGLRVA
ncbi:MAG: type II toxin-antitoxin system VapC family toxin [Sphingobacteriales bacterium]|nr:MAG: type II toxin-antitoxin system VapC family toxin [Sphingobacteriales bacterium]